MRICSICHEEFNPNHPHHKGGYIDKCGDCDPKHQDVNRTIGMMVTTGKTDYGTQIIVNPSAEIRKFVRRQNQCGPSQCFTSLGLNTNGANTKKDKMDEVNAKLRGEDVE